MSNTDQIREQLVKNLESVQKRIEDACRNSGRAPGSVTLIAVTKYASDEALNTLLELGYNQFGERRPQQLVERATGFSKKIEWHMIGHLQRNKVRAILPLIERIHSIDSVRLLEKIDQVAVEFNLKPKVFLEVNVSGEESKDGFDKTEFLKAYPQLQSFEHVEITGLMCMAPRSDDPEVSRAVFRELRELRDQLEKEYSFSLPELSMGMSGDFDVAIEEGATHVRVGSALFVGLEKL